MSARSKLALFFLIPAPASALPCLPSRAFIEELREVGLKPLAVVNVDEDDRKLAQDYGRANGMSKAEVETRYAATGDIVCPAGQYRYEGQGQVTVRNDVVVSAAHVFFDEQSCAKTVAANKCKFTIQVDGKAQTYAIEEATDTGWPCPFQGKRPPGSDWVVLRLKKAVDARVKPYAIPRTSQVGIASDQKVVAVGKSSDWPPRMKGDTIVGHPRHYGDCRSRLVDQKPNTRRSIEIDCDVTHGASGGSLLTPGPDPVLVGVIEAEQDVRERGKDCDLSNGRGGHGTYQAGCWANYAQPVSGALWTAINAATDPDNYRETAPPPPKGPSISPTIPFPRDILGPAKPAPSKVLLNKDRFGFNRSRDSSTFVQE